jgi:F0F1-type ATP synthase assembly protein I
LVLSLSAVLLFAVLVYLLVRYAGLSAWQALICILLGFFLAQNGLAPYIADTTQVIARWLSGIQP